MASITEKVLDKAIEDAFRSSPAFANWFLAQTKFAHESASYCWSRSNHPWGKVPLPVRDPETGDIAIQHFESETDILVVFATGKGQRFALHIENKLANGAFTHQQPDLYGPRAQLWRNNPKYGSYTEYETVLIAPRMFYERWIEGAGKFDRYIAHEDIAAHLPIFGAGV